MPKLQSAYILILAFTLAAFSQSEFCQADKSKYSSYRITADSIVKLYYGDTLLRFITFDSSESYYRTLKKTSGGGTMSRFTEPLDFDPEMFVFQYYFKHPDFNGYTLSIRFYVYKDHRIMEGYLPEGLLNMKDQKGLKIISPDKAEQIAKKLKIKKPLHKYEIVFGWYEQEATKEDYKKYNQTGDIRIIVKGRIVWRVTSKFRESPEGDEKPFSETFIIDALTGRIIADEHAFIDWG